MAYRWNPRAPLAPSAQWPPRKELKHGQHASQRASVLAQYDAGADDDQAVDLRLGGRGFPVAADLCEKVVAGGAGFAKGGVV